MTVHNMTQNNHGGILIDVLEIDRHAIDYKPEGKG
jgi:hypothetical protein